MSIRIISHEKFWRKGSVGVSRDCPNFLVPTIISGMGKATDFKFSQYIQRVHPNKSQRKISEKRKRGRIQGLPNFWGYPCYLRNEKSYGFQIGLFFYIQRVHLNKPIKNFGEKEAWAYPGLHNFFRVGLPSQARVKLRISNFACTFIYSIGTKDH